MKRMLLLLPVIVLYFTTPCRAQQFIINDKELTTMKTFDMERFNRNAINNVYEFHWKDDLYVTQRKLKDYYLEHIIKKDTPLKKNKAYYFSGSIKFEANLYYDCLIGITKYYDESGKLIKEVDEDAPYKFSLEDVIKKVKTEYNIDLTKPRPRMNMSRATHYGASFGYEEGGDPRSREMIYLDGNTGKVYYHQDKDGNVLLDETPGNVLLKETLPGPKKKGWSALD